MGRSVLVLLLSLSLALVVLGRPVVASAEGPSAAQRKKAKKLILKAGRLKRRGDSLSKRRGKRNRNKAARAYKRAALAYIEAHDRIEHPAIVFKLASVYQARGEYQWARRGFRRYLELHAASDAGEQSDDARARINELDALIEAHAASGKPWPEDANTELDPTAIFGLPRAQAPAPEPRSIEVPEPPEPEPDSTTASQVVAVRTPGSQPARWLRWSGIGTAGVGAVLLGVGVGFGASASSAANRLSENDDPWDANDRNLISSGESDARKMVLFTTLGAATLIAGGALYYLSWRARDESSGGESDEPSASMVPILAPQSAGFAVRGSF